MLFVWLWKWTCIGRSFRRLILYGDMTSTIVSTTEWDYFGFYNFSFWIYIDVGISKCVTLFNSKFCLMKAECMFKKYSHIFFIRSFLRHRLMPMEITLKFISVLLFGMYFFKNMYATASTVYNNNWIVKCPVRSKLVWETSWHNLVLLENHQYFICPGAFVHLRFWKKYFLTLPHLLRYLSYYLLSWQHISAMTANLQSKWIFL